MKAANSAAFLAATLAEREKKREILEAKKTKKLAKKQARAKKNKQTSSSRMTSAQTVERETLILAFPLVLRRLPFSSLVILVSVSESEGERERRNQDTR